ncbi:MAG: proline--tRNA ligase [bacterium]
MRFSNLFCPTLKEVPKDADVISHQLLQRAGFIKKLASGIYTLLPLGLKVCKKVEQIVREELSKGNAQELMMPMVCPSSLWKKSERWDKYGKELLRFKDRQENEYCLGPTHEEVVTDLIAQNLKSYKQLPLCLYQITTKFRDEVRPRFGLMRGREFVMKDAYSFHESKEDLNRYYEKMRDIYEKIFKRCQLKFSVVTADSGTIGGSDSAEFMVLAKNGEDAIVTCKASNISCNREAFSFPEPQTAISDKNIKVTKHHTPGITSIEELSKKLQYAANECVKLLVYMSDEQAKAVLVRGDHQINEIKLKKFLKATHLRLATDKEIKNIVGLDCGYLGPYKFPQNIPLIADFSIKTMTKMLIGANEKEYHYTNITREQLNIQHYADLRFPVEGENSPFKKESTLTFHRGIEVGHIFKLGSIYAQKLHASFLDKEAKQQPVQMGCYGIGIGRTVAAAIEQSHDEKGIIWPKAIAPFQAVIIITSMKNETLCQAAEELYKICIEKKMDILIDDRHISAGVKFKDADLIGIPLQIIVGKGFLEKQTFEYCYRETSIKKHGDQKEIMRVLQET